MTRRRVEVKVHVLSCFGCEESASTLTPIPEHCRVFRNSYCFLDYYKRVYGEDYEVLTTEELNGHGPVKSALCQNCGREFVRPTFSSSKMMFCSLTCSNSKPSYIRIKRYNFGDLELEGSYELRFIACCERFKIDWKMWDKQDFFTWIDSNGRTHEYRPDFVIQLNGQSVVIEVKGYTESYQQEAHKQWSRSEELLIVDQHVLEHFEQTGELRKS